MGFVTIFEFWIIDTKQSFGSRLALEEDQTATQSLLNELAKTIRRLGNFIIKFLEVLDLVISFIWPLIEYMTRCLVNGTVWVLFALFFLHIFLSHKMVKIPEIEMKYASPPPV